MEQYRVRLNKEELVFSAGHFITYAGDVCERLHGHNYRVAAEVAGPLDENQYVVDFVALLGTLKEIIGELDHRVLLPTQHPLICVTTDEREVTATFRDRRWVFPKDDCLLLDIPNTTAELLARHIARRLRDALAGRTGVRPQNVRIEVDECYGQWAVCEISDQ